MLTSPMKNNALWHSALGDTNTWQSHWCCECLVAANSSVGSSCTPAMWVPSGHRLVNALCANRRGGRIWLCSSVKSSVSEIHMYFHLLMAEDNLKSRQTHVVRKIENEMWFQVWFFSTHTRKHTHKAAHSCPVLMCPDSMGLLHHESSLKPGTASACSAYTAPTLCHACGCLINI